MNAKIIKSIQKSYEQSKRGYLKYPNQKSFHWKKKYKTRIKLINIKNLKNFRNNGLSDGLDDKYNLDTQKNNFKLLKKSVPENFYLNFLNNKNIGNVKNFFYYKKKIVDSNEIFHIKWLYDIHEYVNDKNNKIFCEIGAGYGSFCKKILKLKKDLKYIIIDLPESAFLSSYFLHKSFPKKKIFLYSYLKEKKITPKELNKYDIFIIPPWVKISNKIKIDFFINTRSFSEMNPEIIKKYFNLIEQHISDKGFFLNINRYEKSTVGKKIVFFKFPYSLNWTKIISKRSWLQNKIHFLLLKRSRKKLDILFLKFECYLKYIHIIYQKKINIFKKNIKKIF